MFTFIHFPMIDDHCACSYMDDPIFFAGLPLIMYKTVIFT